ncbi:hypothetical protein N7476_000840 [Penicillium atrosanguineum]|uniref:DNA-directed RNA polymerase RBP11-like dimerisation domain-containing protein n=1 Tax=Penicillium atrosanguineum TaxID=1132637 RepID=A0A9W9QHI6_9EURO|nr:hypothetical protein N7476_000840 [Penicillium atrosanguineum]
MAPFPVLDEKSTRALFDELPLGIMDEHLNKHQKENLESTLDPSGPAVERTLPSVLSDELPRGILVDHPLFPRLVAGSSFQPAPRSSLHCPVSNTSPSSASEYSRGLPESAQMSSPNPSKIVLATDAIAKDRAGRRDRPAPRHVGPPQVEDRQDPYEAILLGPGENKIDVEIDTRLPSAAIFTFHKEDHTLGNMLRTRLLKTPHVVFAAYKIPHPLTPNFLLRVQTDGEITPRQAVITASKALIQDLGTLSREFTKEYELRKMANAANQQQNIE